MPLATPPNLPTAALPPRKKSLRGGYKLDRRHSMANGLANCWLFNEATGNVARDLVKNTLGALNSDFSWQSTNQGYQLQLGTNVTTLGRTNFGNPVYPGDCTFACLLTPILSPGAGSGPGQISAAGQWYSGGYPGTNAWLLELSPNGATPVVGFAIEQGTTVTAALDNNVWTAGVPLFMVGVKSGTTIKIYRADGNVYKGATASATCTSGAMNSVSGRNLTLGQIDVQASYNTYANYQWFMSWNRALSDSEIKALFQQTQNGGLPAFVQQPQDNAFLSIPSTLPSPTTLDATAAYRILPTPRKKSLRGGYKIARNHPLAQGLVASWLFNEGQGNAVNLCNSVLPVTGGTWSNAQGEAWACRDWTGTTDTNYGYTQGFSVTLRVYFSATATTTFTTLMGRVNYVSESNNQGWTVQVRHQDTDPFPGLNFSLFNNNALSGGYGFNWNGTLAGWHTITCVSRSNQKEIWCDGVLVASSTSSLSAAALSSSALYNTSSAGQQAPLSVALIHNRALNAAEITALYQQTINGGLPAFIQQPQDAAFLALSNAPDTTFLDVCSDYRILPTLRKKTLRGGYKVNRTHPQAFGLNHCFLLHEGGSNPRDLGVSSYTATTLTGLTWANGEAGQCLQNNSATDALDTKITDYTTASGTVMWRIYPTFAIGNGAQRMMWGSYDSVSASSLSGQMYSDNYLYMGWFNAGGDTRVIMPASNGVNFAVNQWQTYVVTWTPNGTKLYWNGNLIGSVSSAPGLSAVAGYSLYVGSQNTNNAANNGMTSGSKTSLWMSWNRALSVNEITALDLQTRGGGLPAFISSPNDAAWLAKQASGLALSQALSETLMLSDSRKLAAAKNVMETLALSDSRLAAFSKAFSEPLSLSDAAAKAAGKGLAESLSLSDTRTLSLMRKLLETLSLSDAAVQAVLNAGGQALSKMLTEAIGLSDSLGKGAGKRLNDALPFSDTLGKGQAKALLESLTINDARMVGLGKQVVETLALTDSRALNLIKQVAETLGLSDNLNTILGNATLYFFVDVLQSGFKGQGDTLMGGKDNDTLSGGRA